MTGGMWDPDTTLRPQEPVTLEITGIGALDALVVRAVPGAAELAVPGALPARYVAGRRCRLEAGSGTLVAARRTDGTIRDDVLHLVLDPVAAPAPRHVVGAAAYTAIRPQPAAEQRRAFDRVELVRPVLLVPDRTGNAWIDGKTQDLSPGGARISGASRLRRGDRLRLLLELGPGALVDGGGEIVRVDADGVAGVRLDRVSARDQKILARYLRARQAAALAQLRATG